MVEPTRSQNSSWHSLWDLQGTQDPASSPNPPPPPPNCDKVTTLWGNMGAESESDSTWWHHQMETFSALLVICARPVTQGSGVFFDLCLNNGWLNNRLAGDLRRHRPDYDGTVVKWSRVNRKLGANDSTTFTRERSCYWLTSCGDSSSCEL